MKITKLIYCSSSGNRYSQKKYSVAETPAHNQPLFRTLLRCSSYQCCNSNPETVSTRSPAINQFCWNTSSCRRSLQHNRSRTVAAPEVQPVAETPTSWNTIPNDPHFQIPRSFVKKSPNGISHWWLPIQTIMAKDCSGRLNNQFNRGSSVNMLLTTWTAGISGAVWNNTLSASRQHLRPATLNQMPDRGDTKLLRLMHIHLTDNKHWTEWASSLLLKIKVGRQPSTDNGYKIWSTFPPDKGHRHDNG